MTILSQAFDSSEHGEMASFEAFPGGDYICQIIKSEIKETKKKDGKYINLTFKLMDGPFKGRAFWSILNIQNKSSTAVDIANKEFATICRACGINRAIQNTDELHGIPMMIKVKRIPEKGDWPEKNEATSYKKLEGAAGPVTTKPSQKDAEPAAEAEIESDPGWG